jgi:rhamnogalacturonan endolyase
MIIAVMLSATVNAQPRYDFGKLKREPLNRGVIAVRCGQQVMISWRCLATDNTGEPFNVYRNGKQLNSQPLTNGGTCFTDEQPLTTDATYEVRGGQQNGSYTLRADAPDGYLPISIEKPADGVTPDGRRYFYHANDASVGDVDGDGQYEIFLKWEPSNAHDNSHAGFTGEVYFDCIRLDGTRLWRINMGRNIRAGAHYTQFMVYDFDGDGCAEMMVKTADGTTDGQGKVIGDAQADWRHGNDGSNKTGHIMEGPEYLSVFNGKTGACMATVDYIPGRGNNMRATWGDDHANRSERYLAAVGYLDGQHASAIFCRGYYTRTVIAAWDWDGKELKNRWTFDTNTPEWNSYAGQGNHNLRVADVDGDGCDEITYGSMAIDNDGRGLYNTGFGHGDAMHLTVFDPTSDMLQVWDCHENRRDGSELRDAKTGRVIFQIPSRSDVGRCMAADIDPTNPGVEMWSSDSHGIRNIKGEIINVTNDPDDPQHDNHIMMRGKQVSINFGIWWDGDLLRELLDREKVTKYDWKQRSVVEIKRFTDCQFNNWTKSNPNLCADIIGDWREEVLTRNRESTELRLYVSAIPTEYRMNCLMQDIPYRLSVATQNVAYNQPTQTGFYLGPDKTVVPFLK